MPQPYTAHPWLLPRQASVAFATLGRYGSRYNGFAYCARNTSRPTAEQQEFAALIRTDRNSLHSLIGTACVCGCMMSFLVVSRPKGQISLDIYVGYSFVSSYVNVQIGCWLIAYVLNAGCRPLMSSARYVRAGRTTLGIDNGSLTFRRNGLLGTNTLVGCTTQRTK